MEFELGEIVICAVERIQGTTVFVNIENKREGYIVLSEIAPGRIRNLRDYVVPKKTIVCKILRIVGDRIELSLRRVTPKEQKQAKERWKLERNYQSILKSVLKEKTKEIVKKILEEQDIYSFLEESKTDSKKLEKLIGKEDAQKVLVILGTQKQKKAVLRKTLQIHTKQPNGLNLIKDLLQKVDKAEIKYLSAGKYSIKTESTDIKKADNLMKEIFENLEKLAKKQGIEFIKLDQN